jgi:hypothetical protein
MATAAHGTKVRKDRESASISATRCRGVAGGVFRDGVTQDDGEWRSAATRLFRSTLIFTASFSSLFRR